MRNSTVEKGKLQINGRKYTTDGGDIIEIRKQLIGEKDRLEEIRERVSQGLIGAPEGTLRLSQSGGRAQYYHCSKNQKGKGRYIHKNEFELAKQLAQKTYDEKILRYTEKTLTQINKLLNVYQDEKIEEIYKGEHPERQKLIHPVEPTYIQKMNEWIAKPYPQKGFAENSPVILTNSGIRVRSKSEKILADYFDTLGIIYKYECPLYLKTYGTVYPDFTFLSKRTGKEIYWEHEGMMDNPDYARKAIDKIETYEKNGILCGENLILTFETSATPISTEIIKIMVQRYLQ